MVHTRINERTANPNPHVNFICALPSPEGAYGSRRDSEDSEAKEMLRAIAAQLRPVMKRHGFTVNSLEEYENNKVFLGRNWNNGETIELVLRDGTGRFYPASRLLGVFCHELAHIKHMNHSSTFHALRRQLSSEVAALQRRGYYGDGYWSKGTRLADSERISGKGIGAQELPEYTCGGAHAQSRLSRGRRARGPAGPSLTSGAQSAKRPKAGSRVTSKTAFEAAGAGEVLDESVEKGGKGSGFRKQAGSQRAREERALAAERRLMAMQGKIEDATEETYSETERDDDEEISDRPAETDGDRLKIMHDIMSEDDLKALRDEVDDDVVAVTDPSATFTEPLDTNSTRRLAGHTSDDELFGATRKSKRELPNWDGRDDPSTKKRNSGDGPSNPDLAPLLSRASTSNTPPLSSSSRLPPRNRNILREEVQQRKREALGMDRPRTLGAGNTPCSKVSEEKWACKMCTFINTGQSCAVCERPRRSGDNVGEEWSCSVCTYDNRALDPKCAMCDQPRT